MKHTIAGIIALLCASITSRADAPKCQVIRLDSSAAELLQVQTAAIPDTARQPLRAEYFPTKSLSPSVVTILTQSDAKALIAKLDKHAKPVTAAHEGFTTSTAASDAAPKAIELTFKHSGRSNVVSLFPHQAILVASPEKQSPDGFRLYLLRLE